MNGYIDEIEIENQTNMWIDLAMDGWLAVLERQMDHWLAQQIDIWLDSLLGF